LRKISKKKSEREIFFLFVDVDILLMRSETWSGSVKSKKRNEKGFFVSVSQGIGVFSVSQGICLFSVSQVICLAVSKREATLFFVVWCQETDSCGWESETSVVFPQVGLCLLVGFYETVSPALLVCKEPLASFGTPAILSLSISRLSVGLFRP
jgi:hypothetical protein